VNAPLPALKQAIEAIQVEHEGKPMILLRDQEGLNDQAVMVTLPAFLLAMMLNGRHTVSDIQSIFAKNTGSLLPPEEIQSMVAQLDKLELLETEELQAKRQKVMKDFLASPVRTPVHEGLGYPREPIELASFLGRFFKDPKGSCKDFFIILYQGKRRQAAFVGLWGMLATFGNASGPVPPFAPLLLSQKGSLFLTRPTLAHYVQTPAELRARSNDLFAWIADGSLKVRVGATFKLTAAADAHRALESRATTGKVLLLP